MKLLFTWLLGSILFFSCSNDSSIEDQMVNNPDPDPGKETPPDETLSYKEKAKKTYDMIQNLYKKGDLYKENVPAQSGDKEYSYLWPYVGMLTAGNILYELGYEKSILDEQFENLNNYYDDRPTLPAYQAYVTTEDSDHFYDDNAIVAMELIQAYHLTQDQFYLDRAKTVMAFIMSGEDSRAGGGIYWFEEESKNCTSGPNCMKAANTSAYGAYVAAELYKITQNSQYLDFAERVYKWTYNTLRDPSDDLYWNDIKISSGQINSTKWTYNAAMMIMSGISLYEITDEQHYLDEAIATAHSAYSRFTKVINDQIFYQTNDSWFNVELMTAFVELSNYNSKAKDYVEVFMKNIDYAWDNARTPEGQFYEDWSGNSKGRYYWLLHQAALIEAYGRAAMFEE